MRVCSFSKRDALIKLTLLFLEQFSRLSNVIHTLKEQVEKGDFFLSLLAFSFPTSIVAGKTEGFRIDFRFFVDY